MGFAGLSIHKRGLLIILIVMLAMFSASAFETRTGTMHLSSTVPRSSGVEVPEGAILVGNLTIQYSYGGSEWEYVTEALVDVPDLGAEADEIWLQVSYYGNEPSDYNCSVDFSTGGWNRQDGYSQNQQSRTGELVIFDNENADLPISFENLNVSVVNLERGADFAGIDVMPGNTDSSFSLRVPVQKPINGEIVAQLEATWPARELPSGSYEADIQIAVSANM